MQGPDADALAATIKKVELPGLTKARLAELRIFAGAAGEGSIADTLRLSSMRGRRSLPDGGSAAMQPELLRI
jgi:hypothetical protein